MATIFKDYIRTIKHSLGRFISIALIVAIGAGFYAGLKSAGPDMRLTADNYFEETSTMDLKVTGNYGIDEFDIDTIKEIPGVEKVYPGYSMDVLEKTKNKNIHIMSIPDLKKGLNIPTLVTGEFPKNENECVIDNTTFKNTYSIGDEIELYLKEDDISNHLSKTKLKVVGTIVSPIYIGNGRGTSTVGNGNSDGFIMTTEKVFVSNYHTEVFVKYVPPIKDIDYADIYSLEEGEDVEDVIKRQTASTFSKEYDDYIEMNRINLDITLLQKRDERKARVEEQIKKEIKDAEKELETSKETLILKEKELLKVENELKEILKVVQISEQEIAAKKSEHDVQLAYISEKEEMVKNSDSILAQIDEKIKKKGNELILQEKLIEDKIEDLEIEIAVHYIGSGNIDDDAINEFKEEIKNLEKEYEEMEKKANAFKKEQEIEKAKVLEASNELVEDRKKADELLKNYNNAVKAHDNREESIKTANLAIDNAKKEKADAEKDIKEKEKNIEDAETELSRLERIYYTVDTRKQNPSYEEYGANSNRIDAIASVFPIFFVLVAALVCLTGMTRLVEEETMLIGTYKAMGYGNIKIAGKYIFYAVTATVIGAVLGLLIGFTLVPRIIIGAYGRLYAIPSPSTPIRFDYTLVIVLVAVFANLIATLVAAFKELRSPASVLMRPKAPQTGKRILLERIGFIWNRFSFRSKITARNVFRYKRRMFMTILGISGCAALLLTGFALKNSLTDIVELQYGDIFHYDMVISVDEGLKEKEKKEIDEIVKKEAESLAYTYEQAGIIQNTLDTYAGEFSDIPEVHAQIFVVSDDSKIEEFITLRDRKTKNLLKFEENDVIITEKMAENLSLNVGDQILIKDKNNYLATVTGIAENYTDHYVYMGEYIYSQYYGDIPDYTNIMVKVKDSSKEDVDSVAEMLNSKEYVRSAILARNEKEEYAQMVSSLNLIVYLLIGAAALLAFIVLYNLTTINVEERKRELSTIKVLGFYDKEVTSYISRENLVLTILGIIVGLVVGVFLGKYVIVTSEVESLMFGREIKILSFILAGALTLVFTIIVNLIMHYQLKKIHMLDATKSFE